MAKKNVDVPATKPVNTDVPAQSEAAEAPAIEAPVAEVEKPSKASKTEITVKYRDHRGEPTERVFSKEDHGEDFAKLADEFKATNAGRIINE